MFLIDRIILLGAVLVLVSIVASKFANRVGMPVLVLFLGVGMLAGSDGPGGIEFENYPLAHAIGTAALALILLDGGLRTQWSSIRSAWKPSLALATVGVVITAAVTAAAARWVLGFSWLEGMLLGGIVGSTDAAAVFALLRSTGVHLKERLGATLEIESGSNDPMAIFLTIATLELLTGRIEPGAGVLLLFVRQMAIGLAAGVLIGRAGGWLVNHLRLGAPALYPLLVIAIGMLAFGAAAVLGGSGFMAVYVAGIVMGAGRLVFERGILLMNDSAAWFSQIVMFVVLGLLSFPARLLEVAPQGLFIALVLIFFSRPIAVALTLLPFRFNRGEFLFLSLMGLKGAVPIILTTYPLLYGLPAGPLIFDTVFFVVLVSAVTQGLALPVLARRLKVEAPLRPVSPATLEISSLRHVDADIVEYTIPERARVVGHRLRHLQLPDGVVIALITRGEDLIPPQGRTRLAVGDHLFVVLRPAVRAMVDRIFSDPAEPPSPSPRFEFPLRPEATVADLSEYYGIHVDAEPECSLAELLQRHLPDGLTLGARASFGGISLSVLELSENGRLEQVGLAVTGESE